MSKLDNDLHELAVSIDQAALLQRIMHTDPISRESSEIDVQYSKGGDLAPHSDLVPEDSMQASEPLIARVGAVSVNLSRPVRLVTTVIPKPWGQEIWYTGMEERGESQICDGGENTLPLSLYLALAPRHLCNAEPVLLLKVLDPKADAVLGDLYFEVHQDKREVYVVTCIDPIAWPDGIGEIRYGMNQTMRKDLGDAAFREQYAQTVATYADLRRQIDSEAKPIDAATEQQARNAMNAFTALRELAVGDVVTVPTWLPHSLQHGVRVVEFQTPTYERYIISFAQKVLTQEHWDYVHAIEHMSIDPPPRESFETISDGVERITAFEDFNVWHIDLNTASPLRLPTQIPYAVCMAVSGTIDVDHLRLAEEEACFIPASAVSTTQIRGDEKARALIAAPRL